MQRIYQPQVLTRTQEIIQLLKEDNFFQDGEFSSAFAEKYIADVLTEKFIANKPLDLGNIDEINMHLDKIIGGSICYELVNKGYLNSYEDENTPEVFFLTEKGKEIKRQLKGE